MFRFALRLLLLTFAVLPCVGCRPTADEPETATLTIYAAASLTDVLPDLGAAFAEGRSLNFQYNFAGSGALAQQILLAPRADLFLSANEEWIDQLEEAGRVLPSTRINFASNQLCVIAHQASPFTIDQPADLASLPVEWFALGDPAAVPAGRYAKRWMETIETASGQSLWEAIEERVSPTPDVRSAFAQVASHSKVVGVVYATDLIAMKDSNVRILFRVPLEEGPPIRYPAAIIAQSTNQDVAAAFLHFLHGAKATNILQEYGFQAIAPPLPATAESP